MVAAQELTAHAFKVSVSCLYALVCPANAANGIVLLTKWQQHLLAAPVVLFAPSDSRPAQADLVQRSPVLQDCQQAAGSYHLAGTLYALSGHPCLVPSTGFTSSLPPPPILASDSVLAHLRGTL